MKLMYGDVGNPGDEYLYDYVSMKYGYNKPIMNSVITPDCRIFCLRQKTTQVNGQLWSEEESSREMRKFYKNSG